MINRRWGEERILAELRKVTVERFDCLMRGSSRELLSLILGKIKTVMFKTLEPELPHRRKLPVGQ